jgi:hypothetical protein
MRRPAALHRGVPNDPIGGLAMRSIKSSLAGQARVPSFRCSLCYAALLS